MCIDGVRYFGFSGIIDSICKLDLMVCNGCCWSANGGFGFVLLVGRWCVTGRFPGLGYGVLVGVVGCLCDFEVMVVFWGRYGFVGLFRCGFAWKLML